MEGQGSPTSTLGPISEGPGAVEGAGAVEGVKGLPVAVVGAAAGA